MYYHKVNIGDDHFYTEAFVSTGCPKASVDISQGDFLPWKFPESCSKQAAPPGLEDEIALHGQRMVGKVRMRFCNIISIIRSTSKELHEKEQGQESVKLHTRASGRPWVVGPQES